MKRLIEKEDVERAVKELVGAGKKVTNNGIYEALGKKGSLTTIVKLLKEIQREKDAKAVKGLGKMPDGKKLEAMIQDAVGEVLKQKVREVVRESFMELVEESLGVMVQQMILKSALTIEGGMREKIAEMVGAEIRQRSISEIQVEGGMNLEKAVSSGEFESEIRGDIMSLKLELVELMEVVNRVLASESFILGYAERASRSVGNPVDQSV